jgi:hypothetical protein
MNPESVAQTSLMAYNDIKPFRGELYQRILAILSISPTYREKLEQETKIKGNTLRPRIREMLDLGVIEIRGLTVHNGRQVEILAIRDC